MHARRLFLAAAALAAGAAPALAAGTTERVSCRPRRPGQRRQHRARDSADGRVVAFVSARHESRRRRYQRKLADVFVRDRQTDTTERVSVSSAGAPGQQQELLPAISADGRFVAFRSFASNLVAGDTNATDDVFVRDRQTGTTERVERQHPGVQATATAALARRDLGRRALRRLRLRATNLVPGDTNAQ